MLNTSANDMLLFATIVEHRSFTAAARHLNVSRSLISKRIDRLEATLGVRLLQRTTRRLSLTEAGGGFARHCAELAATVEAAENELRNVAAKPSGLVKVTLPTFLGRDPLASALPKLLTQHPDLHVQLDLRDHMVDLVSEGFDLGIRVGTLQPSSLIARKLVNLEIGTFAAPEYIARHGMPSTPSDLADHNCLVFSPLRRGRQIWRYGTRQGEIEVPVRGNIESNHANLLIEAARCGLGILYAPTFLVRDALKEGAMRQLLKPYSLKDRGIFAVYTHRKLPPKTRVFIDFVGDVLADHVNG